MAYDVQRTLYALVVKKGDVLVEADKALPGLPDIYEMQLAGEEKGIPVLTAGEAGPNGTAAPTIVSLSSKRENSPTAKLAVTPYMRKSILIIR